MIFVYSIISTLHGLLTCFFTGALCASCDEADYGYHVDAASYTCCDDCLRRQLVLGSLTRKALWTALQIIDNTTIGIIGKFCEHYSWVIPEDHSMAIKQANLHSDYLFPSGSLADSNNSKLKDLLDEKDSSEYKTAMEGESAGLGGEAIFALYKQRVPVMSYEKFCSVFPEIVENDFSLLIALGGIDFIEEVDTKIQRWVPISNHSCGASTATGVASVIDSSIIPELAKDGRIDDVSYLTSLSSTINDIGVGVARTTSIKAYALKKSVLGSNATMYFNLFFTLWLHCGPGELGLKWAKRKCQIHGIGFFSEASDDQKETSEEQRGIMRESWVPESYGSKVPEKIIAQVKPFITGLTSRLLALGQLPSNLVSYLTSKAKMVVPAFVTLPATVQAYLISKFKQASSVPADIIRRVTGKTTEEAASIIFSTSRPMAPKRTNSPKTTAKANGGPVLDGKSGEGKKGKKAKTKKSGKSALSYLGFTAKQQHKFYGAFGGDFKSFLLLKKQHALKGKLDLVKLSEFFESGKPKFGKNNPSQVARLCLIN